MKNNNKLVWESQQRFRNKKYNVFNEKVNKIVLRTNYKKRIQSLHSVKQYAHEKSKDLVCKKEEIK